jgi:hypothetical protein
MLCKPQHFQYSFLHALSYDAHYLTDFLVFIIAVAVKLDEYTDLYTKLQNLDFELGRSQEKQQQLDIILRHVIARDAKELIDNRLCLADLMHFANCATEVMNHARNTEGVYEQDTAMEVDQILSCDPVDTWRASFNALVGLPPPPPLEPLPLPLPLPVPVPAIPAVPSYRRPVASSASISSYQIQQHQQQQQQPVARSAASSVASSSTNSLTALGSTYTTPPAAAPAAAPTTAAAAAVFSVSGASGATSRPSPPKMPKPVSPSSQSQSLPLSQPKASASAVPAAISRDPTPVYSATSSASSAPAGRPTIDGNTSNSGSGSHQDFSSFDNFAPDVSPTGVSAPPAAAFYPTVPDFHIDSPEAAEVVTNGNHSTTTTAAAAAAAQEAELQRIVASDTPHVEASAPSAPTDNDSEELAAAIAAIAAAQAQEEAAAMAMAMHSSASADTEDEEEEEDRLATKEPICDHDQDHQHGDDGFAGLQEEDFADDDLASAPNTGAFVGAAAPSEEASVSEPDVTAAAALVPVSAGPSAPAEEVPTVATAPVVVAAPAALVSASASPPPTPPTRPQRGLLSRPPTMNADAIVYAVTAVAATSDEASTLQSAVAEVTSDIVICEVFEEDFI